MINIDIKKFIIACIVILIIWGSLFFLWYKKTDEVTRDPCSICSERMGDKVRCTTQSDYNIFRDYYPNGSIVDSTLEEPFSLNISGG